MPHKKKKSMSPSQMRHWEELQKVMKQDAAEKQQKINNDIISQPIEVYKRWQKQLKLNAEELIESGLTEAEVTMLAEEKKQLEYKITLWKSKNL